MIRHWRLEKWTGSAKEWTGPFFCQVVRFYAKTGPFVLLIRRLSLVPQNP